MSLEVSLVRATLLSELFPRNSAVLSCASFKHYCLRCVRCHSAV
jgi:hypothetical protein